MNFYLCNTQVYFIPFFLDYCISVFVLPRSVVCSWGVQDQYSLCGLSKVVCFLRGSRLLLWCAVFVIWFWLHSGLPSGFWGLDVALGVGVNQYKFVCVILSFPDLTYICFKLFLLTVDKRTGWIAKRTGWFSGNQLKQFCALFSLGCVWIREEKGEDLREWIWSDLRGKCEES